MDMFLEAVSGTVEVQSRDLDRRGPSFGAAAELELAALQLEPPALFPLPPVPRDAYREIIEAAATASARQTGAPPAARNPRTGS
jgi:hypothetical protein